MTHAERERIDALLRQGSKAYAYAADVADTAGHVQLAQRLRRLAVDGANTRQALPGLIHTDARQERLPGIK